MKQAPQYVNLLSDEEDAVEKKIVGANEQQRHVSGGGQVEEYDMQRKIHDGEENDGTDEKLQVIDDLHDNDVLSSFYGPRPGNMRSQEILEEYKSAYHEAWTSKDEMNVARAALAEFSKRNPTSRFVRKIAENRYAVLQKVSVLNKTTSKLQEMAPMPLEVVPPKRKCRPSKLMEESTEVVNCKKKRRRKSAAKHQSNVPAPTAGKEEEPHGLGKLALKFMRWAFVSDV